MDSVRVVLPEPSRNPFQWASFMVQNPQKWNDLVSQLHYVESCLGRMATSLDAAGMVAHSQHQCLHCKPASSFPTEKALNQHMRMKHNYRDPVCEFFDGSGICPICRTNYHTRLRVLNHVCNTRRTKCRSAILSSDLPRVPLDKLLKLMACDRQARSEAKKQGHTHPIAQGSAYTNLGKRIGHVQA